MPLSAPSHEAPDQKGNRPPVPNVKLTRKIRGSTADQTPAVIGPAIAVDGTINNNPSTTH